MRTAIFAWMFATGIGFGQDTLDSTSCELERFSSYSDAYATAERQGRPLLILLSAEWCPACKEFKKRTLDPMYENGELRPFVYYVLDVDREPDVADRLRGMYRPLPQLKVFTPIGRSEPKDFTLKGMQPRAKVLELLQKVKPPDVPKRFPVQHWWN